MIKSPIPPPIKHQGHNQTMERGSWGPHTAKIVCITCGGEFVKWASTKDQNTTINKRSDSGIDRIGAFSK